MNCVCVCVCAAKFQIYLLNKTRSTSSVSLRQFFQLEIKKLELQSYQVLYFAVWFICIFDVSELTSIFTCQSFIWLLNHSLFLIGSSTMRFEGRKVKQVLLTVVFCLMFVTLFSKGIISERNFNFNINQNVDFLTEETTQNSQER